MVDVITPPPGESRPAVPLVPARAVVAQPFAPVADLEPPLFDVAGWLFMAPPWLLSAIIHMTALIVMGLLFFQPKIVDDLLLSAGYSDDVSTPVADDLDLAQDDFAAVEISEQAITTQSLPQVDDPFSAPNATDMAPNPLLSDTGTVMPTTIGLALSGREAGMKDALVKAYGGTGKTEGAVTMGLRWLANQQQRTGQWSLIGPYRDGGRSNNEAAATAMALLAFQGAGYTPQSEAKHPFTPVVRRGWGFLSRKMDKEGKFFDQVSSNQQLYTQAICTIASCELFGMTDDYEYRDMAQKAVDYCVKIQSPEGGWRYEPGVDSDMSVTGWFVMALQSARMAGLDVPSPTLQRASDFLDSVARDGGSRYAYRERDGATLTLTAEGLLCRMYLGWERDDPRLKSGVSYLLENLPEWNEQNVYYWYYATQVMHHIEDSPWKIWNDQMRELLPEKQVRRGRERGSWDPGGDRWGSDGGRLYVTCLSLYTLEVYYRHLPLYRTGNVGQSF
ncbi:MAG: squalene--hopene cyclase [Pirellulales bacterium]